MKKNTLLVLSFLLLLSGVISLAFASRDAYHSYLSQTESNRRGDNKRILSVRQKSFTPIQTGMEKTRLLRNSAARDLAETAEEKQRRTVRERFAPEPEYKRRVFSSRKNKWSQPLQREEMGLRTISLKETDASVLETYKNTTFSIQVPQNWKLLDEEGHVFVSQEKDYILSVERVDMPCSNQSFTECVMALSKSKNGHGNNRLLTLSRVARLHQFTNTIKGSRIQTETFTEGFSTTLLGRELYVSRYYVSDLEGNVYIIEVHINHDVAPQYIFTTKRIFDSFRILQD